MLELFFDPDQTHQRLLEQQIVELCLRCHYHPKRNLKNPKLLELGGPTTMGVSAIQARIQELKAYKAQWDKFQSDSCYLDENGEVC